MTTSIDTAAAWERDNEDEATAPEPAQDTAPAEPAQDEGHDEEPEHEGGDAAKARREARNLRARLRTAEQERDEARAELGLFRPRVEAITRARAEEMAAAWGLVDASDLWRDGATLDDVTDENGAPTLSKVRQVARAVIDRHGEHLARGNSQIVRRVNPDLTRAQRMKWGVEPALDASEDEWAEWEHAQRTRPGRSGYGPTPLPGYGPSTGDGLGALVRNRLRG